VKELEEGALEGYRIAGLHGRLNRSTRDHVMGRFRAGLIDVLVATTVIEVGVDVPNATAMVIEDAERFGLAQLHQIRGRVGRGGKAGMCIAVSDAEGEEALARLRAFSSTTDGFELAEKDLELRGPGEMFGAAQSGSGGFTVVSFPRDTELLMMARRDARAMVEASPKLSGEDVALLRKRLFKRYGSELGLIDVA
jgi:ATP-dependent DNA helicase RecG